MAVHWIGGPWNDTIEHGNASKVSNFRQLVLVALAKAVNFQFPI